MYCFFISDFYTTPCIYYMFLVTNRSLVVFYLSVSAPLSIRTYVHDCLHACIHTYRMHTYIHTCNSTLSVDLLVTDNCSNIKSIGKPVTHNTRQTTQGAWMKDPLGIMGTETIFVMKSYRLNNVVEEFENMDKFKKGTTRKTYSLPYQWD